MTCRKHVAVHVWVHGYKSTHSHTSTHVNTSSGSEPVGLPCILRGGLPLLRW